MNITIEDKSQIEEVIQQCNICYLGVVDAENLPYVVPMNFGYKDNYIYFHGAKTGKLIDSLKLHPRVCVTFCTDPVVTSRDAHVACSYSSQGKSVIALGKVEFITDYDQKVDGLNILMQNYSGREFKYNAPAVNNVEVYRVNVERLTGKEFGAPRRKPVPKK